jgi:hypothetical protein
MGGYVSLNESVPPHRVRVSIVRHESSIHTSVGNRDAYLVRVTPKSGKVFIARMVDEYPAYEETLPLSSLIDGALFSVALRPTPDCDWEAPDENAEGPVRCFSVVHGSWKLGKLQNKDEWWR